MEFSAQYFSEILMSIYIYKCALLSIVQKAIYTSSVFMQRNWVKTYTLIKIFRENSIINKKIYFVFCTVMLFLNDFFEVDYFKSIKFVKILLLFYVFSVLAARHVGCLSSPTKDQTCTPCVENWVEIYTLR